MLHRNISGYIKKPVIGLGLLLTGIFGVSVFASDSTAPISFDKSTVTYLGAAVIPGGSAAAKDKSKLPHTLLEDGVSYNDSFDGMGSGLAYTGFGSRYLALADRGPNKVQYKDGEAVDFTTSYSNRFQIIDIAVTQSGNEWKVNAELKGTSLLVNEKGKNFQGISTAFIDTDPTENLRLDPEGIRVAPDGTVWISDEYGPVIYHFDQHGKRIGILKTPKNITISRLAPSLAEEMKAGANQSGRYTNRGAEGLALTPDGKTLVIAMQSALIQDGGTKGLGTRFLVYDVTDTKKEPKQLVYVCDSAKTAVSEILAINDHQFLVDERDGVAGAKGLKLIYFIDLNQTAVPTDVSSIDKLPPAGSSDKIIPLKKVLLTDIGSILNAANPFTTADGLPDKLEGLAFGPDLPDGRHLLLISNDNDYASAFPNYIFAFAVDAKAFPEFHPVRIKPGVVFIPR